MTYKYNIDKKFKIKADYTMSSISGIEGLRPTVSIIKNSKSEEIPLNKLSSGEQHLIVLFFNLIFIRSPQILFF